MLVKRTSVALLLLLTVAACASNPMTSSSSAGEAGSASTLPKLVNAPDVILLSSPNQIRTWDFGNPVGVKGLHVRGVATNFGFHPLGEVQGRGKFCADGKDWLSLSDLTVHNASEGQTPKAPYILGCAAGSAFQPASRTIYTQ